MLITKLSGRFSKFSFGSQKHLSSAANASYIHQRGSQPLKFLNVGQLLDQTAQKFPDREALISCSEDSRITFAETLEKVNFRFRSEAREYDYILLRQIVYRVGS